jgi:hypothetical protein
MELFASMSSVSEPENHAGQADSHQIAADVLKFLSQQEHRGLVFQSYEWGVPRW